MPHEIITAIWFLCVVVPIGAVMFWVTTFIIYKCILNINVFMTALETACVKVLQVVKRISYHFKGILILTNADFMKSSAIVKDQCFLVCQPDNEVSYSIIKCIEPPQWLGIGRYIDTMTGKEYDPYIAMRKGLLYPLPYSYKHNG